MWCVGVCRMSAQTTHWLISSFVTVRVHQGAHTYHVKSTDGLLAKGYEMRNPYDTPQSRLSPPTCPNTLYKCLLRPVTLAVYDLDISCWSPVWPVQVNCNEGFAWNCWWVKGENIFSVLSRSGEMSTFALNVTFLAQELWFLVPKKVPVAFIHFSIWEEKWKAERYKFSLGNKAKQHSWCACQTEFCMVYSRMSPLAELICLILGSRVEVA